MYKERSTLMAATCPVCNKEFMPAPFHAYTEDNKTFCKWTCLCEYRRRKEVKTEKKRAIYKHRRSYSREQRAEAIRMCTEGKKTQKEAADSLGLTCRTISNWMMAYREGRIKL